MTKDTERRHRVTKWIRWVARIWSLPIILYALLMFAGYSWSWITTGVADPYAVEDYPPIENLPPILMFLSVLGLGVAWRWERLGGAITLVLLLAVLVLLFIVTPIARDFPRTAVPYLLALVVAIPGILFLVCWWRSREGNP
ncbi:MAG: hypothetical protein JXA89_01555 [Anaerolineae bacterium]|nr:hypothetical protein [Anaerolineae bacterium]